MVVGSCNRRSVAILAHGDYFDLSSLGASTEEKEMTRATLAFQPKAERYYAEGYWRESDLWTDFDARAKEHADRVALFLEGRSVTYAELRRAAVGVSNR